MNEDWDSHCSQEQLKNDEPWQNPDFNLMSRSQQNTEIYKVTLVGTGIHKVLIKVDLNGTILP